MRKITVSLLVLVVGLFVLVGAAQADIFRAPVPQDVRIEVINAITGCPIPGAFCVLQTVINDAGSSRRFTLFKGRANRLGVLKHYEETTLWTTGPAEIHDYLSVSHPDFYPYRAEVTINRREGRTVLAASLYPLPTTPSVLRTSVRSR